MLIIEIVCVKHLDILKVIYELKYYYSFSKHWEGLFFHLFLPMVLCLSSQSDFLGKIFSGKIQVSQNIQLGEAWEALSGNLVIVQ